MKSPAFDAIVLAAGKGTRMVSTRPKVMHPIAGVPMLGHVLRTLEKLDAKRVVTVVGPEMEAVAKYAAATLRGSSAAVQRTQEGTGHAVLAAKEAMGRLSGITLVLFGDTPLIRPETIASLLRAAERADVAVLGMRPADPKQYGRLKCDGEGNLLAIVEYNDATERERDIPLCNSGVIAVAEGKLFDLLSEVTNENAKNEYYLTDIVAVARQRGWSARVVEAEEGELLGVNSRAELAEAEAALQTRLRAAAMAAGVSLPDPGSVRLSADTLIGRDTTIEPFVVIGPGVTIGSDVTVRSFSHLEGATIADGCIIGPFARLRPGSELAEDVHVGNFVEIKNATLGRGAKANHLSYLGDAQIGEVTNIGAGTITCNYDGFAKHQTVIGRGVFVGSQTALVAPVKIGDGAIVGAGSTITRDVAKDALAITRPEMVVRDGAAEAFRARRRKS